MWGLLGFDLRPTRLQALLGVRTLLGMHHQQKESSLNLAGFVRPTQRAEMTHQRAEMTMNPYRRCTTRCVFRDCGEIWYDCGEIWYWVCRDCDCGEIWYWFCRDCGLGVSKVDEDDVTPSFPFIGQLLRFRARPFGL